ncbi:TPA: acyl carrier protein [Legionella pneumophila]|uniref:Acyl carrier protein n=2 Tax=Legionella pneumophila TaxID=446 RepID=Q5ZTC9_LEGPH|nr:phosphopantetheine-binding protein [Legionella pneumophila]WBV63820.1 phosphopantetheine-binding protein [Legionella pneumophila 130b]AAU28298.1 acyl carrier protein [Legionella pneumophila subsp. pneumophila str. Philadelphia 1]AEW52473.1 acyl carrier protein [Legionella pneumophila subsp. pneumophila ATCC 43290]AGH52951.1 Acyl carrier protein [Legionella pneumophila subsp. pneumophila LPE509]AGN15155.1 acyl carrier protein [Legionella pneumophila subsp. pneumophila str. Thunder Bay]
MKITDEELKKIISKLSGSKADEIQDDTALIEDLHLDSLKIVELLAILSEEYQLEVSEEDAMNFHTYKDLYDFTQA